MRFKVSQRARSDLLQIGRYTQKEWGKEQRCRYLADIDRKFGLLAENPHLGRQSDGIRKGYFRFEYMSHIIFYRVVDSSVLISRVLHKSMDIKVHLD